jgi:hypothetical protein
MTIVTRASKARSPKTKRGKVVNYIIKKLYELLY